LPRAQRIILPPDADVVDDEFCGEIVVIDRAESVEHGLAVEDHYLGEAPVGVF
jgi:hypothetical protein